MKIYKITQAYYTLAYGGWSGNN